jgi:signal transduction histidine kinase
VELANRRILVVDDDYGIHEDFRSVLGYMRDGGLDALEAAVFDSEPLAPGEAFQVETASQGEAGCARVAQARALGAPFALAFVDMRMPPGWDGMRTIDRILEIDDEIQIVLCTAWSDCPWSEVLHRFAGVDRILILRKPFDAVEVRQMASALTARWMHARNAEASRATLKDAARVRQEQVDVFAMMSHELRTPLNAIIGFSDLLGEGTSEQLTSRQAAWAGHIGASGRHLLALVNDFLDLSKLAAGKLEVNPEEVDLQYMASIAAASLEPLAATAGVVVRLDPPLRPARPARADPLRTRQVLVNLLANAIKFTPRGGRVWVSVSAAVAGYVRVCVRDEGPGIAPEEMSKLFLPFSQLDAGRRHGGGTGLGLALCRRLVARMDGHLGAECAPGGGASFYFDLPTSGLRERIGAETR